MPNSGLCRIGNVRPRPQGLGHCATRHSLGDAGPRMGAYNRSDWTAPFQEGLSTYRETPAGRPLTGAGRTVANGDRGRERVLLSFRQSPATGGLCRIILEANLAQGPIPQPSGPP